METCATFPNAVQDVTPCKGTALDPVNAYANWVTTATSATNASRCQGASMVTATPVLSANVMKVGMDYFALNVSFTYLTGICD